MRLTQPSAGFPIAKPAACNFRGKLPFPHSPRPQTWCYPRVVIATGHPLHTAITAAQHHASQQNWPAALHHAEQALLFNPTDLEALTLTANILLRLNRWSEAVEAYKLVLATEPNNAPIHNNLGVALGKLDQHHAAVAAYTRALELDPTHTNAWFNLGKLSAQLNQPEAALQLLSKALACDPNHAYAHHELGSLLEHQGLLAQAAAAYRTSAQLDPTRVVRDNLARVLALSGDPAGLDLYRQLLRNPPDQPDDPEAHWNLGMALLLHGHLREGWAEFESRTRIPRFAPFHTRFPQPRWNGEPLGGRTILLYSEQGHGDTLQFLRYLPLVADRGGRIVLEVPPLLHRLLQHLPQRLPSLVACIPHNHPRPPFDTHASLMSLPVLTAADTIPPPLPLGGHPSPRPQPSTTLNVGLAWSGNPKHKRDHLRSIPLAELTRLAAIPHLRLTSLQALPLNPADAACQHLFHFARTCHDMDFADLADVIAGLDLVIAVDTAVAHLAGTLGKPVLIALSNVMDWRWGNHPTQTPWYPSARLFRQATPASWHGVVTDLATALHTDIHLPPTHNCVEPTSGQLS